MIMDLHISVQEAIVEGFSEIFGERFKLNEPLSRYVTARSGGSAEMISRIPLAA